MYTTYDIFDELLNLRGAVDRFFSETPSRGRSFDLPLVNVYEKGDDLEIRALAPGLKPEDMDIQLIDNSLVIEGEKKIDYADRPYIRKERSFGRFKKSVRLPFRVDADKISANIRNGVMVIRLTRSEEAKPRRIQIS